MATSQRRDSPAIQLPKPSTTAANCRRTVAKARGEFQKFGRQVDPKEFVDLGKPVG
jgi:hypothetical protein